MNRISADSIGLIKELARFVSCGCENNFFQHGENTARNRLAVHRWKEVEIA